VAEGSIDALRPAGIIDGSFMTRDGLTLSTYRLHVASSGFEPVILIPGLRARLSADGQLFTCLFATTGHDLRSLLRGGASDVLISNSIANVWQVRSDRYSEIRSAETVKLPKAEMSYLGG